MKNLIIAFTLAACTLTAPVASFAQSNEPVTRAQVRADLVQVERAGYNPARGDDINYPADIQAAEAKVALNDRHQDTGGYGRATGNGTSSSGRRATLSTQSNCVGPVSYCDLYFGS
jgi:hypothetical protein